VKPQFLETMIFWRPGNLYCDRRRASRAVARSYLVRNAFHETDCLRLTRITSSDTQDDLTNVDTGNSSIGLTPGTTHSSLQSIGTGARQHLVDSDDMVRVGADTEMETFLSGNLDQVSVDIVSPHHMCIQSSQSSNTKVSDFESRLCVDPAKIVVVGLTHLLAQIRAASKASELNCSYSLETKWTQRGNSSTFARFRPRSKIPGDC
jgi:hypothetical protein